MASPSLVDTVHQLSAELRGIANLLPHEDPLQPPPGKENVPSFLFEISTLVALLRALKNQGWTITAEPRAGRVRLVRAPARKSTGSVFHIEKAPRKFQITQGTKVSDRHGEPRAPDICLQRGTASDSPTHHDVLAIWDAKLRGHSGLVTEERISDPEFRSFVMIRAWLAPPRPPNDEPLADWPEAFRVCALISNGLRPTEPEAVLIEAGVSIVEQFGDEHTPAWPSRLDHIAAGEGVSKDPKSPDPVSDDQLPVPSPGLAV
jgi:hypothetical protein